MNVTLLPSDALLRVAAEAARRSHGLSGSSRRTLPLRVGTRTSPLALVQTRHFLNRLSHFCPVLRDLEAFQEHQISTEGDRNLTQRLAEIGGKGLFAKEIHEALQAGQIDFAVHSLKDLETHLPDDLVLACTMTREDARDVIIRRDRSVEVDPNDPFAALTEGAVIGCASVRRQAQMLARRPDLRFCLLRGNVQTRLAKLADGACDATLLALAGLRRLGLEDRADIILEPEHMLPASGQGIVGVTVRRSDEELRELLGAIEDLEARWVSTAERALLDLLDGSCRTPIGGYARIENNELYLRGLVASEDGSFILHRELRGAPHDAAAIGREVGAMLKRDTPADIFAEMTRD
ncbi:hydroxymethylbilane synthase [Neokomagataea thailandica]|uniref:hydroxymethylbilane synthase n=1 Tax=Neokomagataea TaxID=1223423 RepID=UPI00083182A3|nr:MULTISPECIES: hydroxymethylbilane synthase [Neokomagataea]